MGTNGQLFHPSNPLVEGNDAAEMPMADASCCYLYQGICWSLDGQLSFVDDGPNTSRQFYSSVEAWNCSCALTCTYIEQAGATRRCSFCATEIYPIPRRRLAADDDLQ